MSLNKVMLIGNVGKDPEIRYIDQNPSGNPNAKVATFPLATTERYRDRNGETRENTEWHNIVAWRGLADTIEKYVKKGTQLYIEGRLRTRSWTDQTGNKKYTTEIMADSVQLLGKRSDNPAATGAQGGYTSPFQNYQATPQTVQQGPQQQAENTAENFEPADDLPF